MDIPILYEDKQVIVCVKPAGMASQDDHSSDMDLASYLKNHIAKDNPGQPPYIGVVHRLDRPVGGVMVYAKTPQSAKVLSGQFSEHKVRKVYIAVLMGKLPGKSGVLTDYLKKNGRTNLSEAVPAGTAGAKPAKLNYKILRTKYENGCQWSLAEIVLDTGRHHQIRVQTAHAGAGICGDKKYNGDAPVIGECTYPALFACELTFIHPQTKRAMTYKAKPEEKIFQMFS